MKAILQRVMAVMLLTTALAGCAANGLQESTGQYLDDSVITTKIKGKLLADKETSAFAIGVDTYRGRVQLNGFVKSQDEKERAAQLARTVPGVKVVVNSLQVK